MDEGEKDWNGFLKTCKPHRFSKLFFLSLTFNRIVGIQFCLTRRSELSIYK